MANVFPEKMVVHEFSYKMNGITMGELYLLDSSRHNRQVAFLSTQTVAATTPWHGSWHGQFTEHLTCYFDYLGRPDKAAFKWAHFEYDPVWDVYSGHDYRGRSVMMKRKSGPSFAAGISR